MNKKLIALALTLVGIGTLLYVMKTEPPFSTYNIACSKHPIKTQTEGPYYKLGSPQNTNLYSESIPGEKVVLSGFVLNTDCKPIANAWIDFWQANGKGEYDNNGYTLRGHQYTDANGKFLLTTVIPGEYPGRTPHIHFKIRANNDAPTLTSQLYLPDNQKNESDSIFDSDLVVDMTRTNDGLFATYNIIIPQ